MQRRRRIIRASIWAIALGLLAFGLASVVGPRVGAGATSPQIQVLYTTADIASLQPITPGLVIASRVSADTFRALGPQPVVAGSEPYLVGAVAQQHIAKGQPLLWGMLAGPKIPASADAGILPGSYGLYAIQAPYLSGPTSGLAPDTWVDVTATYAYRPAVAAVGPGGVAATGADAADSPYASTTVETKVRITDVRGAPQPAVTLAIPRGDARILDWFKKNNATFSFLQVNPTAPSGSTGTTSYSNIKDRFDVPTAAIPAARRR